MALDAFGKIFETMYSGSMVGAGEHVFSLWPYCIAHVRPPGVVEINPKLVAAIIGTTAANVQSALDFLCAPDPESRSKVEGGRRLVREGQFLYRMVNFAEYRARLSMEVKRENDKNRIAEKRATSRNLSQPVAEVAQAEAEAEAEAEAVPPRPSEGDGVLACKIRIGGLFQRKSETAWSHAEESTLCELYRRPGFHQELEDVQAAYRRDTPFMSQSVARLLTDWTANLDRARNGSKIHTTGKQPEKTGADKTAERAMQELRASRQQLKDLCP